MFCSWVLRLIVFAFSDNLSAENSKLSAESGHQRLQLLECMRGVLIMTRFLGGFDIVHRGHPKVMDVLVNS